MGRCDVDAAIPIGESAGSFDVRPPLEKMMRSGSEAVWHVCLLFAGFFKNCLKVRRTNF